jgi:steroid delta-isomerase-like uncharacterized protein
MTSRSNTAVTRQWNDKIWNEGDLAAVQELVTENFVFHGLVPDFQGHTKLKETVSLVRTAFPDGRFSDDEIIEERDKVVWRWTFRGTHQGEFFGAAATGKPIAFSGVTVLRVAGGKVAEHWGYFDLTGFLRQVGKSLP